jgi:hypothetical protein
MTDRNTESDVDQKHVAMPSHKLAKLLKPAKSIMRIEATKYKKGPTPPKNTAICLRCDQPFPSFNVKTNRICGKCSKKNFDSVLWGSDQSKVMHEDFSFLNNDPAPVDLDFPMGKRDDDEFITKPGS